MYEIYYDPNFVTTLYCTTFGLVISIGTKLKQSDKIKVIMSCAKQLIAG